MSTFKSSNPITHRLSLMRGKWMEKVKPQTKAVIWRVELDEVRMVQAFVAVEASEHGELPVYFLDFSVPFQSYDQYGQALVDYWLNRWGNEEARKKLIEADALPQWNTEPFQERTSDDGLADFLNCMSSFAEQIKGIKGRLMLCLVPSHCDDKKGLAKWMSAAIARIPDNLGILLHDMIGNPLFEELSKLEGVVTLQAQLNMHGAMKEIVSAGDPNDPGVKFNLCVLNIGEALNNGDEAGVHHWGKAAVEIGKALKSNALESTGWVVYGTSMYQLKKFDESLKMYTSAQVIAETGRNTGDVTCAAVLLQALSMKGAAFYLIKKQEEAAKHYEMMAIEAGKQGNYMMECEGYRLLAQMPPKTFDDEERIQFLQKAFFAGLKLHPETQKYSSLHLVCVHLVDLAAKKKNFELHAKVDSHARSVWGEQWRDLEKDKGTVPMISETQKSMPHVASV
jgi:tetratricopeptide (TPR) repeat protein